MALITFKELEALTAAADGKRISMGKSLYGTVRVGVDGAVSVYVVWRYRFGGKVRQIPVGTWKRRGLSLKAILIDHAELSKAVSEGIDPIERNATDKLKKQADQLAVVHQQLDRMEALTARDARLTTRGLFDIWRGLGLRNRADKGTECLRAFERDVFPLIGDVAAVDVTKAHVQTIVDTMMAREVVRMTKRVFSDLRQMFVFALDRDLVTVDPTAQIKKDKIGPDGERDRVLSGPELTALFSKLPLSGLVQTSQCALLIQLSTITRIGEVLGAKWADVDLERRLWTMPKTKNGKPHTVWLSDYAMAQFERLHRHTGLTDWAFPSSNLNGPVSPKTVTKQTRDRQRTGAPMSGRTQQIDALAMPGGYWTPHDLRRTGASMMADLGVLPEVVEKCLNHTEENRMKRIYQRAKYEGPIRDAWQLLGQRLELLARKHVNVVTLRVA